MALLVGTDTYVTVAEADTYFTNAIHAASWIAASTGLKEQGLATATRMLERQQWVGTRTSPSQTLDWPRTGVTDPEGNPVSSVVVPQFIKDAECELALALIQDPSIQTTSDTSSNTKRLKAGSAEIEYFRPTSGARFPTIIMELIGFYLSSSGAGIAIPFASDLEAQIQIKDYDLDRSL